MGEHGAFFWSIFDSKNFFFYSSFFIAESQTGEDERESRASALSLSLLRNDTAIRCEEQLIKH